MKKIVLGIVAHVDSGKTTLTEALLYQSGTIRKFGRVDKGESFLDTDKLERKRGITIYSKMARLPVGASEITLLDTPGHSDFSAEMERTLQVLDYALLIISAADGVNGYCQSIWKLLEQYGIPTFIFVNKMDQPGSDKVRLLADIRNNLSDMAADFTGWPDDSAFHDRAGMFSEESMEEFLANETVSNDTLAELIAGRKLFPCFWGSALRQEGSKELLNAIDSLTLEVDYPDTFGARVYKILRDDAGHRLSVMKITGGVLPCKTMLPDGPEESKINQIRLYSGDRFQTVTEVRAGDICAVDGLKESFPGQGFGYEEETITPLLSPVIGYRAVLPEGADPVKCLPYFRTLEEENPELSVKWEEESGTITVQVMGQVQLEILTTLLAERYGLAVTFDNGKILYRETLAAPVIGVGHFEPLRHYAEVHLLMEPLPLGSGIWLDSMVSTDLLAKNWQRLVLTHLAEKEHKGVLTGSPLTDVKITLVAGKAHIKHTEGGDFRQATYRAVRQGLMMGECALLEPYYRFVLELPAESLGRAMTDMGMMAAAFAPAEIRDGTARLVGRVPAQALGDYARELAAYTSGQGRLTLVPDGYGPCHNSEAVIAERGYDPLADVRNTADSVFCANGAGYNVPYDQVYEKMHLPLDERSAQLSRQEEYVRKNEKTDVALGTEEIDSIIAGISRKAAAGSTRRGWKKKRAAGFGARGAVTAHVTGPAIHGNSSVSHAAVFSLENAEYVLVDGYNVIYAWEELAALARDNLDAARISLQEALCGWQFLAGMEVIAVFDAYRVPGHNVEVQDYSNIHVVFTKEAQTADQYIERFAHEKAGKHKVAVVTSDGLEQVIIRGQGCLLVSSREFKEVIDKANREFREKYSIK